MLYAKSRRNKIRATKRHRQRKRQSQRERWAYGGIDQAQRWRRAYRERYAGTETDTELEAETHKGRARSYTRGMERPSRDSQGAGSSLLGICL